MELNFFPFSLTPLLCSNHTLSVPNTFFIQFCLARDREQVSNYPALSSRARFTLICNTYMYIYMYIHVYVYTCTLILYMYMYSASRRSLNEKRVQTHRYLCVQTRLEVYVNERGRRRTDADADERKSACVSSVGGRIASCP